MTGIAQTLEAITDHARSLQEVRKEDLRSGDRVMVTTRNSLYTLWALSLHRVPFDREPVCNDCAMSSLSKE